MRTFSLIIIMLVLAACSGGGTPQEEGIDVETVADGLVSPVALVDDGSGRLFVVEQVGTIRVIDPDEGLLDAPFLDVSDNMVELAGIYDERGLLGMALHPDYADNGRFFVYYSAPLAEDAPPEWDHTGVLAEYSTRDAVSADPASERVIMTVDQPYANHNGGELTFGPDGYLYWGLGDGGSGGDPLNNGQDPRTVLGSILRLDVDSGDPYAIPEDNPFLDGEDGLPEVYAYGFRNPYKFSFDDTHGIFVADVGQNAYEEVSLAEKGGNHGWKIREGFNCYSPLEGCGDRGMDGEPLIDPILEYDHEVGLSVIGGYVYEGRIPELQGSYIFGDWSSTAGAARGQVFVARQADDGTWSYEPLVFTSTDSNQPGNYFITGFGRDASGEVYILADGGRGPNSGGSAVLRIISR